MLESQHEARVNGLLANVFTYTLATSILEKLVIDLVQACDLFGLHS